MKLCILTSGETALAHLSEAYRTLNPAQRRQLQLVAVDLGKRDIAGLHAEIEQKLAGSDLVLLDAHGVRKETVEHISGLLSRGTVQTVPLGGNAAEILHLLRLGKLTSEDLPDPAAGGAEVSVPQDRKEDYEHYVRFTEFWRGGGTANLLGLIRLAGRAYGACDLLPEPAEPRWIRELCIYEPREGKRYSSLSAYRSSRGYAEDLPNVAVLFLGNGNPLDIADCVGQLMGKLEAFANVMPIAFPSVMNIPLDRLRELLFGDGRPADLIVNLLPFRLGMGPGGAGAGDAGELLSALEAPMLHPFMLSGTTEREWRQSVSGLDPSQLLVQVVLPELDGSIEMYPIAALQEEGEDAELGVPLKRLELIAERTDRLIRRIRRWLDLRRKPNREKKLAIVCYNYPPGEGNVFGASFLDTFESVARVLTWLKRRGYRVEEMSAAELQARFTEDGLVNSGKWTGSSGQNRLIRYPDPEFEQKLSGRSWGEEAMARWGKPPGDVMSEKDVFLIPGMINGNVAIVLQPTRGIHEDPQGALHDRSLLPTHQYTAFYQWIREAFKADAVLHFGTHGTLEFQRGKECALSGDCIPDDFIGDLPHLYCYYVGNPSEAVIAKRRSHAVLIGYQGPPFTEAGLHGEWRELEALLHEYREARLQNPDSCDAIFQKLRSLAEVLHLTAATVEQMEEELYRMRRSLIPSGLHVLGEGYPPEAAVAHMKYVLRHDREGHRALRTLLAEGRGKKEAERSSEGQDELLRDVDAEAERLVEYFVHTKSLPPAYAQADPDWVKSLTHALEYGYRAYESAMKNEEAENLLKALEGRYIPAKLAGDIIRSPEVLPSGRNLYQFDPRSVPSRTAAERGSEVAESSIRQYREKHGTYPNTTAVILWGLETSRTQGESVGQILRYIGVRIRGGIGSFRTEYEVIPLSELGRPRLNVVVHMSGLFRDMFPNLLEDLNRLFRIVSELEEPEELNGFKAHTQKTKSELLAAGYDEEQAHDLACARIFGPAEGEYGTTVNRLIETKQWSDEAELGQAYADSQQHVYSLRERGRAEPRLYRLHLLAVDIVSQIRSSHEWEVTDSDHYYEYFGGLSRSLEKIKGRKAEIHITDTTGERMKTESAEEAISRGIHTRLTNPKWISGLMRHPYQGTREIARRFEYVLGLAATTGQVQPWVFDRLHNVYFEDEALRRRMKESNRWAYHAMMETLLESHQRGYWQPDVSILDRLRQDYIELEGDLEGPEPL